ncbi:MAG TPA: hypothetical protein PLN21_05470 [Gemmatales bacterium]|nr:hypothetical protein [Gemmatales bacterium]
MKAAQSASSLRKKGSRYSSTVMLVAFGFLALLILASLAITFLAFGLTRHGVLWSLSIIFFFVGASAIVTKRLLGKRAAKPEVAAQIEPAVAGVVGGLCLLPLALCAFYYSTHTDMPPNHSLWIVGIMLVLALVAVVAGSVALSKAS